MNLYCPYIQQSISNVHFMLNQNCNLRNKGNSESETWAKWLTLAVQFVL